MIRPTIVLLCLAISLCSTVVTAADWAQAESPLSTRWAKEVSPENALPEYPRPQLVRDRWVNLNGLWDYAITSVDVDKPRTLDGEIFVPFAIESSLSGVGKSVQPDQALWYHRQFETPKLNDGERLLLHFGAVDWETTVWVNGQHVGQHRGCFDPFSFDITDALADGDSQQIAIRVWDPTDTGDQPRGKQVLRPGGIFYTAVTGIWQTVWLEPVPAAHIRSLKVVPDIDNSTVSVTVDASARERVAIEVRDDGKTIASARGSGGETITLPIPDAKLWAPASPHLYDLEVDLESGDDVSSYFGMRKIAVGRDDDGALRMFLNNKPLFQYGPLDQGWWPDGLYTAPTDEALKFDIEVTRELGFNMARKHTKVEPARWYYWADKLGLLVWQDMPTFMARGQDHHVHKGQEQDARLAAQTRMQFYTELRAMIDGLHNHPSIVVWVPFNEGWGQHRTNEILQWTKQYDPTRLVDGPSGWEDRGWGDLKDMHNYPGPGMFPAMDDRVSVLGEFGGLGLPLEGHLWQADRNWGYRTLKTREQLAAGYERLVTQLHRLIGKGLAAAVFTQTTDVEIEVNGLLSYDRQIVKIDPQQLKAWHSKLYEPPPIEKTIVATSENEPQTWRFTTSPPTENWFAPDFDDSEWKSAPGGFGTKGTPNTTVRTNWNTPDIWVRRTFTLDEPKADGGQWLLSIYHDEDAEIFINGIEAARVTDYTVGYITLPISKAAATSLKAGENIIAIHCHQTQGGQFIDAGLLRVEPATKAN